MVQNKVYDCVIIGAGPSGLTCANNLVNSSLDFLIIDKGDFLYNRHSNVPADIVSGVGGGGLYSDGKVSFYPSGSNLYKLEPELLTTAYQQLVDMFNNFNIEIPPFDREWISQFYSTGELTTLTVKEYQSAVLSQEELFNVGFYLYDQIGKEKFLLKHDITKVTRQENIYYIELHDRTSNVQKVVKCKNVVLCVGKFGSMSLSSFIDESNLKFKKFEFGIRVETEHDNFDFKHYEQTDLKLLIPDERNKNLEFRTFCFCKNGYIVHGKFDSINSFNGVSNKPKFSKTNFGINLRIKDEFAYKNLSSALSDLKNAESIVSQDIKIFIAERNPSWRKEIHDLFVTCLTKYFPQVCNTNATVTGPSFEYFGYYPKLNNELKLPSENIWVCGDATGDFRGLLPSLVSGYMAGMSLIKKSQKDKSALYDSVRIKLSATNKTRTIFTAQSKKFFYCKDNICEFIFKSGGIPVNPFQVFGYFLDDRVDRNLVRNGNNELITRCDELWVFGSIADGVFFEIARAYQLNMPVRFFTIGSLQEEIIEITDINKLTFEPEVHAQVGKEALVRFISQLHINEGADTEKQLKLNF
jgi:uncharacterized FAD-dependent dehydrogenase